MGGDVLGGGVAVSLKVRALSLRYMALKAVAYIGIGGTWLFLPSEARAEGVAWLEFVTPPLVGVAWIVSGIVAAVAALYPSADERMRHAGWVAVIATPSMIGFYFLIAWLIYYVPGIAGGAERGIITTLYCAAFAVGGYVMARVYTVALEALTHGGR